MNLRDKIALFILGVILVSPILAATPDGFGKGILTIGLSAAGIVVLTQPFKGSE